MRKIEHKNIKQTKMWNIRKRFVIGFYSVTFLVFSVLLVAFYIAEKLNIPLNKVTSPILITFIIASICIVLGYVISYIIMRDVFTPLENLSNASKKIAKGDYNIQIDYQGHIEEIESTIDNFNFMTRELNSIEMMRNDFIANVSHEFKTPLSSINGYVTLLQDPDLSKEEQNEYIQMAFFNIEKLNDLTSNILQLSKLENQNALPDPVEYRLDEQIREAIVLLEPKWNQKQISFNLDLQEIIYVGQSVLLFQVWTNLIGNAIKFSHSKSTITVNLHTHQEDIEINISDEGIGMSQETQAHIFEKFYQGDSSRREQGNGLGLPLCKKILDLCDGNIYVSSELGKGTIFRVRL